MKKRECHDMIVYVCHNCIPLDEKVPRQWVQDNVHVQVKEVPCSGKIDTRYILHVLEGGSTGIIIITCPKGDCRLSQGNYRVEIRVKNVKQLLEEIGVSPEKVALLQYPGDDDKESLEQTIRREIERVLCSTKVEPQLLYK
jgi:coenzyme F420-reducing hydrogenase delta subunit